MRERRCCVANCGCRRLRGAFCKELYKFPKWLRDAYRVSTKIRLEASGFTKVTDRKEMRFVTARPRFVIVASHHALRFLDARIRRIFGLRVARHVLDVRPRRSVVVHGGAAAPRVSLADATGASRSSPSAGVDLDDRAGSAPALWAYKMMRGRCVLVDKVSGDFAADGGNFCGAV